MMKLMNAILAGVALILCMVMSSLGQASGSITIDSVIGGVGTNKVRIGTNIVFKLRYQNSANHNWNISNGFVVYSPDSASWNGPVHLDTLNGAIPQSNFDLAFAANLFSGAGILRHDTLGILGAAIHGQGLPSSFDGVPYGINIGSFALADVGKHICIDSAFFRPGGYWEWAASGGLTSYPSWSGPYSFKIVCCIGKRGNVNGQGIVDLGDLSALVSYLTGAGFALPCPDAANVNGQGIIDLGDLTALVSYLTGGGFVLPNCP